MLFSHRKTAEFPALLAGRRKSAKVKQKTVRKISKFILYIPFCDFASLWCQKKDNQIYQYLLFTRNQFFTDQNAPARRRSDINSVFFFVSLAVF